MADDSAFYRGILDNIYDGVYFVDRERKITFWNKGAERITGYSAERVIGSSCFDNLLMHVTANGVQLCLTACPLVEAMENGNTREADVFLHHADGHRVPVHVHVTPIQAQNGEIIGAVETFTDNSSMLATLKRVEELQKEASLDALTQVGNRGYSEARLNATFAEFEHHKMPFGILFIDVDHFKLVNDRHGHNIGDRALKMLANTLARNLRAFDFVGRWGGEEFIILVMNVDAAKLVQVAEKLRVLVEQSHFTNEHEAIRITISIGAAVAQPGDTVDSLISRADQLLYQSKQHGRNRVSF
jgi:diguanylate cyclase (GGDEF)-like protein/PAS domain S-box-containing protein